MKFDKEMLEKHVVLPKGKFSLPKPLLSIYGDDSKNLIIMKGAQAGITTLALLTELLYARYYPTPLTIIHAFPTNEMAKEQSERLTQLHMINKWVGGFSGSKMLRKIKNKKTGMNSSIIISGVSTERDVIATDADFIVTDEFDRAVDPDLTLEFESRTLASSLGKKMIISIPYAGQGTGIAYRFENSTQTVWFVHCKSCNKEVPLIDRFWNINSCPPYFECPECHKPLDPDDPEAVEVRKKGRYKSLNPTSNVTGYHISRLLYPHVKLSNLIEEYPSATEDFWYIWIGGFPAKIELPIKIQAETVDTTPQGYVYLGIDVAVDYYTVAIAVKTDEELVISEVNTVRTAQLLSYLQSLINQHKVVGIIADSAPEQYRTVGVLDQLGVDWSLIKYGMFQLNDWYVMNGNTYLVVKWEAIRRFLVEIQEGKVKLHKSLHRLNHMIGQLRPIRLRNVLSWSEPKRSDDIHASVYAWFASKMFGAEPIASQIIKIVEIAK